MSSVIDGFDKVFRLKINCLQSRQNLLSLYHSLEINPSSCLNYFFTLIPLTWNLNILFCIKVSEACEPVVINFCNSLFKELFIENWLIPLDTLLWNFLFLISSLLEWFDTWRQGNQIHHLYVDFIIGFHNQCAYVLKDRPMFNCRLTSMHFEIIISHKNQSTSFV